MSTKRSTSKRVVARMVVATFAVIAYAACATTGATYKSGVADAFPEHPPYAAGKTLSVAVEASSKIGHLPIVFQDGASQPSIFDPRYGEGTAIGNLLIAMNAYLDSSTAAFGISTRLAAGERVSAVAHAETRSPPDVIFGCITEGYVPNGDCVARGDSALGRNGQRMRLAVGRPSAEWISWISDIMGDQRVQYTLVLTLEIGQLLPRQRGLLGKKEVELGTGYTVSMPWITSLETPVSVLQLTGALVGPDGRALRIAAEGIMAHRTRILVSAAGGQELLSDQDVNAARDLRRDDLEGHPLAWQVALANLVGQLTPPGN